ncbi:MAG: CinA family protein [Propioniciclava sp.]|uniref:CinA family protein n=1 Tax=Propioniciclava sp. TaxID=2038686 RepID=UPI0039E59091
MNEQAAKVITTLKDRTLTLAVAESLTGGLIGATLTSVPGSSAVFLGGVISYATRLKTDLLDIGAETIRQHTVVSEEVAIAMAAGLQQKTDADWVIAVTGVAGPDPQDGHAPGEVWVCVVGPRTPSVPFVPHVQQFQFEGDREAVRAQTVDAAFGMLLRLVSPV